VDSPPGPPPAARDAIYPDRAGRRRAVGAWCLFDFASSSYTTLIVTVAFSVFFIEVVVDAPDNRGDDLWGRANFLAMLIVALSSPVLGAIADYSGRKKTLLVITTLQTVLATALLFFVGPGQIWLAMTLYIVATVGFEGGYVFYNSFLPEVSTPRTIGKISGWAWGIGFIGGLAALLLCAPLLASELKDAGGAAVPAAVGDRQLSFLIVALFYLVFAIPAFLWLRSVPATGGQRRPTGYVSIGFRRVAETLKNLRQYRETGKYVLASLFFNDGITTIIVFSAAFATTTFGFSAAELLLLFVVLNIVAFPAAVGAGYLADAIGARRTLIVTLLLWVGVVLGGYVAASKAEFWAVAVGAALGMGSTQAVGRSFMAQITPPEKEAEFFGFYVLSGKFASTFGPLIFGWVSYASGSQRLAVLSLLPLFLAGLALMFSIREQEALALGQKRSTAPSRPA
jgi:UMF1 family MFS transporter